MKPAACMLLALFAVTAATAQEPWLRSTGAKTLGAGLLEIGAGAEYAAKADAPFSGAPTTLWRLPAVSIRWGAASNVDFRVDWPGRLLAGYEGGARGSDWGDPVVSTVIAALDESGAWPALGLRTAVKIPSTSFLPYYLGSDQTDFTCALVASRHLGNAELRVNLGLGILGNPRELGSQDDVYSMSAALLFPAGGGFRVFAEAYGVTGYKSDDDDKLLLRSGVDGAFGCWQFGIFGGVRAAGTNGDFGVAFAGSEDWSAGVSLARRFAL